MLINIYNSCNHWYLFSCDDDSQEHIRADKPNFHRELLCSIKKHTHHFDKLTVSNLVSFIFVGNELQNFLIGLYFTFVTNELQEKGKHG